MSIHWRSLDKEGKVAAIKAVYQPGMRAKDIAACFEGVTRNAILGLYTRCRDELVNCRLPGHGKRSASTQKETAHKRFFQGARPKAQGTVSKADVLGCGKPIILLGANQCRWPVNDAEVGELHLFCGMPTEGRYCEHHSSRAYRSPE